MAEQEHTAGRDGESRRAGDGTGGRQGGSEQSGRRHSWGSKAGKAGARSSSPRSSSNDHSRDRREPGRTGSERGNATGSRPGGERATSNDERRGPRSEGGFRGTSSGGRPAGGRPAWKGQSDPRGADRAGGSYGRDGQSGQGGQRDRPAYGREARAVRVVVRVTDEMIRAGSGAARAAMSARDRVPVDPESGHRTVRAGRPRAAGVRSYVVQLPVGVLHQELPPTSSPVLRAVERRPVAPAKAASVLAVALSIGRRAPG